MAPVSPIGIRRAATPRPGAARRMLGHAPERRDAAPKPKAPAPRSVLSEAA